ncbi:GNAT family N-acetyltransferase [Flammeovirga sp. EKP202]|uniref:GNAT family N-acetyltransferase n=1 Tax=Flammeovirga sp. EKP202 TaxID=2770592 RepID=UPI00165FF41D|nr:GNAT family N-acetyltransferase [Flammeovirga sp. EKP202]MBD0400334.1 GNAT family N-acetyltransferase [Flammeovirga sp. EKP202]
MQQQKLQNTVISTERLYLKRFSPHDAPFFFNMNLDQEVMQYTGDPPFKNIEETRAFIESYDHYEKYDYGRWSVYLKENEQYIGFCGLKYSEDKEEIDIGFRFVKDHWNKGYATEAALGCFDYAQKHGIQKIVARANERNKASLKVIQKLGMTFTHFFEENKEKWHQYEIHFD